MKELTPKCLKIKQNCGSSISNSTTSNLTSIDARIILEAEKKNSEQE